MSNLRERLDLLKGKDLVAAIADELIAVQINIERLSRDLQSICAYQSYSRYFDLIIPEEDSRSLPEAISIQASESLLSRDGFWPIDYDAGGTPFRWTGPDTHFAFHFFVDRKRSRHLSVVAVDCVDFAKQKGLRVFVDGEPVSVRVTAHGRGMKISAELPARHGATATEIVIALPHVGLHPEVKDGRLVGLAFAELEISATPTRARKGSRQAKGPEKNG